MRLQKVVRFLMLPIIFAFQEELLNLAITYFKHKNVVYVCNLICHDLDLKFAKVAFQHNIAVTSVNLVRFDNAERYNIDACLSQTSPRIGVLINSKCPIFENIVTNASKNYLFDSNRKWLILNETYDGVRQVNGKNSENFLSLFHSLNLSVNADIVVATRKALGQWIFYDVYNFGKNREGRFVVEVIGIWKNITGLDLTKKSQYYRRFDFQRMVLKLILVMTPPPKIFDPKMILTWSPVSNVPIMTTTSSIFLHELAEVHNISYNYTAVNTWVGDYNKNHAYTVTNALYFQEHDVTPVLRLLKSHFDKYDVTFAVSRIETRFFYKIPSYGIGKFENQFLKPLSWEAWLSVIGIAIICGVVLMLTIIKERRNPKSLTYVIFTVGALFCQQFFEEAEDLRKISSVRKFTILVTGLFCLLIYNYYTSSVVSWLLSAPPPSINSLWEILNSPLQPVLQETGFSYSWLNIPEYYFNTKEIEVEKKLKNKVLNLKKKGILVLKSIHDGISLVKEGGYAYHGETDGANKIIAQTFDQSELCDLGSLKSMDNDPVYVSVQKRSPYKDFFSWSSLRLKESGILNRIHRRTLSRENRCGGSSPRALALGGAAPAFILLAAGFAMAVVVLMVERFIWKYRMKINKTTII